MSAEPLSTEPSDLAPHVEPTWAEALVLELRLRDVPGDVIGDVLAEVESHVVDSRSPAHVAFGDPVAYAAQIAETTARPEPDDLRTMVSSAAGGTALVVVVDGAVAWWRDGTFELTGGTLALALGITLVVVALFRFGTPLLRALVTRPPWQTVPALMAVMGLVVGLSVLAQRWHVATFPAAPVTLGALAVVAATTVLHLRSPGVDPLVAPGADRAAAEAAALRESRRLGLRLAGLQAAYLVLALALVVGVLSLGD